MSRQAHPSSHFATSSAISGQLECPAKTEHLIVLIANALGAHVRFVAITEILEVFPEVGRGLGVAGDLVVGDGEEAVAKELGSVTSLLWSR